MQLGKEKRQFNRRVSALFSAVLCLTLGIGLGWPAVNLHTQALEQVDRFPGNGQAQYFDPGYLLSDYELFDFRSLTAAQIQAFINDKYLQVNGTSQCREGQADETGKPTPCLKDYVVPINDVTKQPLSPAPFCRPLAAPAGKTAAQLISEVSEACGINPKVFLTLLQKEQSLLTLNGPRLTMDSYKKAVGFRCPDSAPCDSIYSSLVAQLYGAGSRLHQYVAPGSPFNHHPFTSSQVMYSKEAGCEGSPLWMKTNATAMFYNYTPYQPHASVIKQIGVALPAEHPDYKCRSYGNLNFWRYYGMWFSDSSPGSNANNLVSFVRISGQDRAETSVAVSRRQFPNGAKRVYLARQDLLVDALAAGAVKDGPVLLVPSNGRPNKAVMDEIDRLNPSTVVAIGGEGSVTNSTLIMAASGREIARVGGTDRFAVAANLANYLVTQGQSSQVVYLVDGMGTGAKGSPDALSAGMLDDGVILFVSNTQYSQAKAQVENLNPRQVVALGGEGSVSQQILNLVAQGRPTQRIAGSDRYATSALIAQHAFPQGAPTTVLANGEIYADAVSGGVLTNTAIILVPSHTHNLSASLSGAKAMHSPIIGVLGGQATVSNEVAQTVAAARFR